MDMACDRGHAVLDAIMECRPSTIQGLAVMARAAQLEIEWWHCDINREMEHEVEIQFDLAEAILSMRNASALAGGALRTFWQNIPESAARSGRCF
jgi:hypothetical protein